MFSVVELNLKLISYQDDFSYKVTESLTLPTKPLVVTCALAKVYRATSAAWNWLRDIWLCPNLSLFLLPSLLEVSGIVPPRFPDILPGHRTKSSWTPQ